MTKEQKEAIEYLKTRLYGNEDCKYIDVAQEDLRIFINLIDRKEKDIEGWKKYCEEIEEENIEMNNKNCELEFKVEKLQKENENLKSENSRLKVIRYSREYGTENIYLITKSDLVQIDINKYMIEIEDGKFVDLKQIYQENEKYKRLAEMNLKSAEEFKNNICKHRCLLKSENKEQKELIERMKRFLLKENKMRDYLDYQESEE